MPSVIFTNSSYLKIVSEHHSGTTSQSECNERIESQLVNLNVMSVESQLVNLNVISIESQLVNLNVMSIESQLVNLNVMTQTLLS